MMAIMNFKREIESSEEAYATYTIMDNGGAQYDDSEGRHIESLLDIDVLCLFCTRGKMPVAVQNTIISMMTA